MNTLLRFIQKYQFLLFFLLLEGISIWLLASNNYYQRSKVSSVTRAFHGFTSEKIAKGTQYFKLRQINEQLAGENLELRRQLAKNSAATLKYEFSQASENADMDFEFVGARIINNSVNKQNNFLTINAGKNKGIELEMGVVTNTGVVGIVSGVSEHYATVISLLNVDFRISAKLERTGYFGSLYWDGNNYKQAILSEIPQHVSIMKGDTIVTSGFSSIFPSDIPLGTVESFDKKAGNFYTIRFNLINDFKQLDYVWIVTNLHKDERETLENPSVND
ncbi:MAG TPA: rod shape-determining protein MreC [Tenuifilaceae bacterium]|nr:rod shape-determining protein MreC [Tenuifilaceae bacterium]HPE17830.1 rod shape-determining protein MreC [Tenuifilaceae bacterium]HPJ45272.1 rod shape-determining protein MreC [Tenuifilaceae bacterium]HPQ33620.1 rod shape-determining protein MreC [Tenuifilaceae bacterium]HRX67314.1 rod shape-determining protein MreC [Tenuifilaceae bacterium]